MMKEIRVFSLGHEAIAIGEGNELGDYIIALMKASSSFHR